MKRLITILLITSMLLCFAGCNKKEATEVASTTKATKADSTTVASDEAKQKSSTTTTKSSKDTTTAHVHTYNTYVKTVAPTSTEQGYDVYQCSCGAQTKTNYVAATGQSYPTEADAIALKAALRAYGEQNGLTWNSDYNEDSNGVNYDTTMTSLTPRKTYEWSYNNGCEYLEYVCLPYSCREFDGGYDIFNIEYWPSGDGYMFRCYFGFSELL